MGESSFRSRNNETEKSSTDVENLRLNDNDVSCDLWTDFGVRSSVTPTTHIALLSHAVRKQGH